MNILRRGIKSYTSWGKTCWNHKRGWSITQIRGDRIDNLRPGTGFIWSSNLTGRSRYQRRSNTHLARNTLEHSNFLKRLFDLQTKVTWGISSTPAFSCFTIQEEIGVKCGEISTFAADRARGWAAIWAGSHTINKNGKERRWVHCFN